MANIRGTKKEDPPTTFSAGSSKKSETVSKSASTPTTKSSKKTSTSRRSGSKNGTRYKESRVSKAKKAAISAVKDYDAETQNGKDAWSTSNATNCGGFRGHSPLRTGIRNTIGRNVHGYKQFVKTLVTGKGNK